MASQLLRQSARTALRSSRAFSSSSIARKDLVQDLYLKEIKAYKAPPPAKDAHVGSVKEFAHPAPPKVPALPSDIAAELAQYDGAEPAKAEQPQAAAADTETGGGAEAYLAFLEQDEPKADEAHH